VTDFEYELQMASTNRAGTGDRDRLLTPAPEYHYPSSSTVGDIARFGGDVSAFVPPHVARRLRERAEGEQEEGSP
jgi:pantetheine-phosphate adenylyltransferase